MASLLARFFPGTTRADSSQTILSNSMSEQADSTKKFTKRRSSNVKARKSIPSFLGFVTKVASSGDGFVNVPQWQARSDYNARPSASLETIATCEEAQHYPIYDPKNPEHEPRALSTEKTHDPASMKRASSRSPTKVPSCKRSSSPKRPSYSPRQRSKLQGLADTLRVRAKMFYEQHENSSKEEVVRQEASIPLAPSCAKSISLKKSVRFRSGHSVISHVHASSSPIPITIKPPPSLPMVNISSTPMSETASDEGRNLGSIGRPPETLPLHIPHVTSLENTSQSKLSLEIDDNFSGVQGLPTPMPGTTLPLDDPFDDVAAASRSECPASRLLTGQVDSDRGYISEQESDADMNEIRRTSSAQSNSASSPHNKDSLQLNLSGPTSNGGGGSWIKSPSADKRTIQIIKPLSSTFKAQPSLSSLPSETRSDTDAEPSDGGDQQKKPIRSMAVKSQHHRMIYTDSTGDSHFGADLFGCKTPNKMRSAPRATFSHLALERPSSNEIKEAASFMSSGGEAMMQSVYCAENEISRMQASSVYDLLEPKKTVESLSMTTYRSILPPFEPALEQKENTEPKLEESQ